MNRQAKIEKLKEFKDENEFRLFIMDLLGFISFKKIQHTHRHGRPELGKDIIASLEHTLDDDEWYAFVVKKGRIIGNTDIIENVKNQIKQAFEYPYETIEGKQIKINKVRVLSNENISEGARETIRKSNDLSIYTNYEFWWNEKLIELIDKHYPDFWLPGDLLAKEYNKRTTNIIETEFEIKELSVTKLPEPKVQKLLQLFVTPQIVELVPVKDRKMKKKIQPKKVSIDDICDSKENFIIKGDPGSGKSRLINEVVSQLLDPQLITDTKTYPIKLRLQALREIGFNIEKALEHEIKRVLPDPDYKFDFDEAQFVIFIDSIDDLYREEINELIKEISLAEISSKCRYIISARSIENINLTTSDLKFREVHLLNFNRDQIELFVKRYFEDINRGKRLLEVLRESNILEKLPTTPLTMTLISVLYEDTDYEIPATLTDIYNDFTNILLGKLEIKKRTQLIDLESKKRVFSHVAHKLIQSKKFEIQKSEFISMIESFLEPKGITANREDLERLVENSGIIYTDSNGLAGFKHQSFLEYFAAFEIFYVTNSYDDLVSNFNDVNWQNSAIFYAGFSKDMPWFVDEIIAKIPANNIRDWFLNVGGMGYLCQALYMTDITHRSKLIERALGDMMKAFHEIKNATKKQGFFRDMPLHILGSTMMYWFNINFRSVTTIACLENLFDTIISNDPDKLKSENFETGFKLFLIATTLANEYLDKHEKLNMLIEFDCLLKDPLLILLCDAFIDIENFNSDQVGEEKKKKLKREINRYRSVLADITREPAYRFLGEGYKKSSK